MLVNFLAPDVVCLPGPTTPAEQMNNIHDGAASTRRGLTVPSRVIGSFAEIHNFYSLWANIKQGDL